MSCRGARHVTVALVTVALGRHRSSSRAANGRNCAAPNQPKFCDAGPGSQFWAHRHGPQRRCAAKWKRCRCGRASGGRSPGCKHLFCRHAGGRNLEDDKRWNNLDPTHRQASVALDRESLPRSHRPNPQNFDRGDGPHRQWDGLFDGPACFFTGSGGLRNGLLYSQDGGNTWASLAEGANQSVVGVAARGNVMVAGTFEISGLGAADKNAGALFRSTNGGATFTQISGGVGTGLPNGPVSSIVGDPNNPNRLYAAVTRPRLTPPATPQPQFS